MRIHVQTYTQCCAHVVNSITCLVMEDDIRFMPVDNQNLDDVGAGLVIGCRHHKEELKRRYGDMLNLSKRAGM